MRTFALIGCLSLALTMVGCGKAIVANPLTENLADASVESQMAFWHTLAERSIVSNDEAFHAVMLYHPEIEIVDSYDARVATLKEHGLLHQGFDSAANEAITRGDLAVILAKLLEIDGGVTMQLFGPSPRYATRELVYRGIYPPSSPNQTFTGDAFVAMIGRAEDYQRAQVTRGRPTQADPIADEAEPAS